MTAFTRIDIEYLPRRPPPWRHGDGRDGTAPRRGFDKFMVHFHDMFNHREILEEYSEFVRGEIRARIKDTLLAEKLVPKDH